MLCKASHMQFRRPLTKDEEEIRKRKGRVALLAWVLREEISNMDQFYHPERKKKGSGFFLCGIACNRRFYKDLLGYHRSACIVGKFAS